MTTLVRPNRSVWLAGSEAKAPRRLETTVIAMKKSKLMW